MRIHTSNDTITVPVIRGILQIQKDLGRIAPSVRFKTLDVHKSNSLYRAFEVQLEATQAGQGRRLGNSGSYGAGGDYAATYDEWGWLLAGMFRLDTDMVCGRTQHPMYDGRDTFLAITGEAYSPETLGHTLTSDPDDDPYPYVFGRAGLGRYGYGRSDGDFAFGRAVYAGWIQEMDAAVERWEAGKKQGNQTVKYLPRTIEEYRKFANPLNLALTF
jgi:hypothetical protein